MNVAVGSAIREAREATPKWSQEELAKKAHVSRDTVRRAEAGEDVRISTLQAIAGVLDRKTNGNLLQRIANPVRFHEPGRFTPGGIPAHGDENQPQVFEEKSVKGAKDNLPRADSEDAHQSTPQDVGGSPVDLLRDKYNALYGAMPEELRDDFVAAVDQLFMELRTRKPAGRSRAPTTHAPKRRRLA